MQYWRFWPWQLAWPSANYTEIRKRESRCSAAQDATTAAAAQADIAKRKANRNAVIAIHQRPARAECITQNITYYSYISKIDVDKNEAMCYFVFVEFLCGIGGMNGKKKIAGAHHKG